MTTQNSNDLNLEDSQDMNSDVNREDVIVEIDKKEFGLKRKFTRRSQAWT